LSFNSCYGDRELYTCQHLGTGKIQAIVFSRWKELLKYFVTIIIRIAKTRLIRIGRFGMIVGP